MLKITKIVLPFYFVDLVLNLGVILTKFEFLLHLNEQTVRNNFEDVELSFRRIFNVYFISN